MRTLSRLYNLHALYFENFFKSNIFIFDSKRREQTEIEPDEV